MTNIVFKNFKFKLKNVLLRLNDLKVYGVCRLNIPSAFNVSVVVNSSLYYGNFFFKIPSSLTMAVIGKCLFILFRLDMIKCHISLKWVYGNDRSRTYYSL